jgi:predicted ATPase/class 3 adenylate cyclase
MAAAMALPAGTVTLLFSDIEGSTRLLESLGERYADVLDEHRKIVRGAIAEHGGYEVRTEGDAFFVAFTRASDAVRTAVAAQRGLAACAWPGGVAVRVRMGLHTGEPRVVGEDYVGMDVHRAARICSAAYGGQVLVSETTERVLADQALEGVGVRDLGEHRLKDLGRPLRIYQVAAEGLVADFAPLRAQERPPTNLLDQWAESTALFGREADLEGVARLVRELGTRLVTLVGPGGVGKTRLAIATAAQLAERFADRARFVALGSVSEPRELASAIARALGAPIREGEPSKTSLLRFLADRHLLLVLDNFEQLVQGAPLIGELLAASPELTVMITSREPTGLRAERLYPVRPLDVPEATALAAAIELERYGAVAMFCDRARARDPDFALDEASAPHVREICRRLDGLPLALELAAARIGVLAPAELAARLNAALAVLVGGARDAPERQRTLRATIDWSFRLLTGPEQHAFVRMAVFAGGATVAAAEEVTGAPLDTLDSLVAKQLLVRRDDRLLMLETVREYALERLTMDPDADAAHDQLATWCLAFGREAAPHLVRADRVPWLARLDAELPNLLAALSWALNAARAELTLNLVGAWGEYWWRSHRWEDGLPWLDAALEHALAASSRARATALLYRARLVGVRQHQRFRVDLEASLDLFRVTRDAAATAACVGHLAVAEAWIGHDDQAKALRDEAVQLAELAHDEGALAFVLAESALSAVSYEDASRCAGRAVAHLQRVGNLRELALVCSVTGYFAIAERRYQDAVAWLNRGLEAARRLGDPNSTFLIRGNHGLARLFLDELEESGQAFREALAICREAGWEDLVDETLLGLAAVAAQQEELARAAGLSGAAREHEAASRSVPEETIWSRLNDEILTPARDRYGPENWDRAARQGASLTVQEAIELALAGGRLAPPAYATPTAALG